MKKIYISLILIQLLCIPVFSQYDPLPEPEGPPVPKTRSFVKSTTYLSENHDRKAIGINYIDAFGRPIQAIAVNASPGGKDIVQSYKYDTYGRQHKSFLPFIHEDEYSNYIEDSLGLQAQFYQSLNIPGGNIPYAEAVYDGSPYNRVIRQSAPGDDINTDYTESGYLPAGSQVEYWYVNNLNQLVKSETYDDNSLMKFTTTGPDGKQAAVYKDNAGKTILSENTTAGVKTRYVYDKYGRLRYVLSPEAVSQMTGLLYTKNDDLVKKYCYYYEYNNKHQLTEKQLPGKDPIYYRYDDKYRLRMTQDGNQRTENNWAFINYDYLGRTVSTGITDTVIIGSLPNEINLGEDDFLSYQFYDNYDFVDGDLNFDFDTASAFHDKFDRIRGKSTGSKIRFTHLDGTEDWLISVVYYDKYGRAIQSISQNHKGGYEMVNSQYNFAGELLRSVHKHSILNTSAKYLVYTYDYDQTGRLLNNWLSQNADGSDSMCRARPVMRRFERASQKSRDTPPVVRVRRGVRAS